MEKEEVKIIKSFQNTKSELTKSLDWSNPSPYNKMKVNERQSKLNEDIIVGNSYNNSSIKFV